MSDKAAIQQAILKLAGMHGYDKLYLEDMEVVSADEDTRTCLCNSINGKATITNMVVRLMASVDDGLLRLPAKNSMVVVAYSTNTQPFVLMYSAITKILCITGDQSLQLVDGQTQLNDGSFGGLTKVPELVDRLNKIEQDINTLKNAFSSWVVMPQDGGNALFSLTTTWAGQQLTTTQRTDIENTKITHGDKATDNS